MVKVQNLEKYFLCPFPGLSTKYVRVHRAVQFVHILHVSIIILYCGRFHSFSVLITETTLCRWRMHICQMFTFHLSFQTMAVKLPLTLTFMSTRFIFILCPKFSSIPFLFDVTVPSSLLSQYVNRQMMLETKNKLFMYSLYPKLSSLA